MDPSREQMARELFDELAPLGSDEREHLLAQRSQDEEIRVEVRRLLSADDLAQSRFLEEPALPGITPGTLAKGWIGRHFGPWEAVEELGRGGMGVVLLGRRADGRYEGRVAIKVVHTTLMGAGLADRFRKEGQILASLDHPNIARLFDAGDTEDGLSYLVMEAVDGPRIDHFADSNRLNIVARLNLFRKVLDGVQYAHDRSVIHRDLKPSNILVTRDGTPKLVDFGIAKLLEFSTDGPAAEQTVAMTRTGLHMMTPEYASPEQIRNQPIDISSDVYSLGVVLYRLLTGRAPYEIPTTTPKAVEQAICETAPRKPSTAITRPLTGSVAQVEASPTPVSVAADRATTQERLQRDLRGDIDTIVLTALEKDPHRRYSSAGALAADIDRYLSGHPIQAEPPRIAYRTRKFVARHRTSLSIAAIGVALLTVGLWQSRVARLERERAADNSAELARLATSVVQTFNAAQRAETGDTEAREAAVSAALTSLDQLVERSGDDPSPDLLYQLSGAYREVALVQGYPFGANLGRFSEAFENLQRAVTLVQQIVEDHPEYSNAHSALGQQLSLVGDMHLGMGAPDSALVYYRRSEETLESRLVVDPGDLPALDGIAVTLQRLANLAAGRRDLEATETYLRRSMEIEKRYAAASTTDPISANQDIASVTANLAVLLGMRGRPEEAIAEDLNVLSLMAEEITGDGPRARQQRAATYRQLAQHEFEAERLRAALLSAEKAVNLSTALSEEDPANAEAKEVLGLALATRAIIEWRLEQPAAAESSARHVLTLVGPSIEARMPFLAGTIAMANRVLGEALTDQGSFRQAEEALSEATRVVRRFKEAYPEMPSSIGFELALQHQARRRLFLAQAESGSDTCAQASLWADSATAVWSSEADLGNLFPSDIKNWDRYETWLPTDACS